LAKLKIVKIRLGRKLPFAGGDSSLTPSWGERIFEFRNALLGSHCGFSFWGLISSFLGAGARKK
jgi:hypothetical protein